MIKTLTRPVTESGWYEHADGTVGRYLWVGGRAERAEVVEGWQLVQLRERGVNYLMARACGKDGRVRSLLTAIYRASRDGRYPDAERDRKTLDDLVYTRFAGDPAYADEDVTEVSRRIGEGR
jgi:hypothetical protein